MFSDVMWVKQCHKPPIWEWFIPHKNGDLGDILWHCFTHSEMCGCVSQLHSLLIGDNPR
jgi:hypothetical protein